MLMFEHAIIEIVPLKTSCFNDANTSSLLAFLIALTTVNNSVFYNITKLIHALFGDKAFDFYSVLLNLEQS